jgi:TPR repeat protein
MGKPLGEMMNILKAMALSAILAFGGAEIVARVTAAPSAPTQPARTPGEDLYHRGFYDQAIAWWTDAAAKGDADAAYHLGVEYMDGKPNVVQRDYDMARKYHMQAATAGDARSMMDIGTMYEYGLGVPADLVQAALWYERSANYGYGPAQYNLATLLETGDAGRKDEVEAFKFYLLAADQGVGGVPYDRTTNRVVRGGDGPIDTLAKHLTKAQIADATARAKAFKPQTGPLKI